MSNNQGYPTGKTLQELHTKDLIVFDDLCVMCSGFARFVAKHDTSGRFLFVSAFSELGHSYFIKSGLDPEKVETNIALIGGHAYLKLASFTAIMSALGWPWRLAVLLNLLPKRLADRLYDLIAQNRYRFGRLSCPVPSEDLKGRLL